jgi:hypothetical protein
MDFIERCFGISPDAGSGALEAAILLLLLIVLAAYAITARRRRFSSR